MQWSFLALGTVWWIEIFDDLNNKRHDDIKEFVTIFVSTYETHYSRFKEDSFVSILNKERSLDNPSVELVHLLRFGKNLYLRTDTAFNFLTGHILEARGYDASYSMIDRDSFSLTPGNPITDLTITDDHITLTNGNIDLGGYGKGYLIDLLAIELQETLGVEQFLINGGGDMYATHQDGQAIEIHLEHPTQPRTIGSTSLLHQGFAASSPHKRAWKTADGTQNHIIATRLTADATFVKASTAAEADAFATTILQLDKAQTQKLAQAEQLEVAQFTVTTSLLVTTKNFDLHA